MALDKEIIVAIEFASSQIRGVAGYKNTDGSVQVIDVAQVDARNWIRKGIVHNIDKTVMCLRHVIEQLEHSLDMNITKVYVGLGGQSLRTRKNVVSRQFATKTIVSQEMVDSMMRANRSEAYPGMDILEVIPQEYRSGVDNCIEAVGLLTSELEGTYLNVVAKQDMKEYVLRCIEECNLDVAGVFVSPLVLAESVLTDTERRSGCALVDMGYGTTTVAVYKNNLLRHLVVIPLGGHNITQDLCTQQIEEDEAEDLKLKYGVAYVDINADDQGKNLLVNSNRTIEEKILKDIVEAREEEILMNVLTTLQNSGYFDNLNAGVVVTGGASMIKELDKALDKRLHGLKVRYVRSMPFAVQVHSPELLPKDGSMSVVMSVLNEGRVACAEAKPVEKAPVEQVLEFAKDEEKEEVATETQDTVAAGQEEVKEQSEEKSAQEEKSKPKKKNGFLSWLKKTAESLTSEE